MAGHGPFLRVAVLVTALTGIVAGFLLIIRPSYLNWGIRRLSARSDCPVTR